MTHAADIKSPVRPPPPPIMTAAMQAHAAGHIPEAIALYREALEQHPTRTGILFLLGLALSQGTDLEEGERVLRSYIALMPNDAAAFHTLGKIRQSLSDDAAAIELFEKGIALSPDDAPLWNDLGTSLHRLKRYPEAIAAFNKAIACNDLWALPHYNLGTVYVDIDQPEQAENAYRAVLALDSDMLDTYAMLALVLDQQYRPDEAQALAEIYAERAPVTVKPSRLAQPRARVLLLMAAGMCNVRTDFLFDLARYETVTTYVRSGRRNQRPMDQLPPFDIVFSALADPDRASPFLEGAIAACDALGAPVLNRPDHRIEQTRRDLLPQTLRDIPGVIVPSTRRMTPAELREMAATDRTFDAPLLVRPTGLHGGRHLERIASAADLTAYMQHPLYAQYYLSAYYDYCSPDGYFRKYRFIFVDRQVFPYHLAISSQWLVHYFRTDMGEHAWMRAEEAAFLADYRQVFPGRLGDAVCAIAARLDLDFAGLDCAITPDGRLVVFEANAAMLVHLDDPIDLYPYKHHYVPRIFDAIDVMVARRMGAA